MIKNCQLFALVLLAAAAVPCSADIYRFVDADGKVHFTDVRLNSRYELIMKTPAPAPQASAPQAAAVDARAANTQWGPVTGRVHKRYGEMITQVAREQQVDPALIHAVVAVESGFNPKAISPKGATGLMQLMPDTAKRYGVSNIHDPMENLRGGARYLRDLLGMFNNNLRLAIAAYNAGEGAVMRAGNAIPNYRETRAYVPRVLQQYERYRGQAS